MSRRMPHGRWRSGQGVQVGWSDDAARHKHSAISSGASPRRRADSSTTAARRAIAPATSSASDPAARERRNSPVNCQRSCRTTTSRRLAAACTVDRGATSNCTARSSNAAARSPPEVVPTDTRGRHRVGRASRSRSPRAADGCRPTGAACRDGHRRRALQRSIASTASSTTPSTSLTDLAVGPSCRRSHTSDGPVSSDPRPQGIVKNPCRS